MHERATPRISITLSPAQLEQIQRASSESGMPSISTLIAAAVAGPSGEHGAGRLSANGDGDAPEDPNRRLSQSLLRGLSILTCFGPDNRERGIVELGRDLGMSASTAHRYALTLLELGLLERSPRSRKYRLASASDS
jgi:IclR helix-turn-helix domain